MDGRIQTAVIEYLKKRFDAPWVDNITEAGPNLVLAERTNPHLVDSILGRLQISIELHGSISIAVVGHHDCARNPAEKAQQLEHTRHAVEFIKQQYDNLQVIGLWVNENWEVEEVE
jgi:carbonic anhydrase